VGGRTCPVVRYPNKPPGVCFVRHFLFAWMECIWHKEMSLVSLGFAGGYVALLLTIPNRSLPHHWLAESGSSGRHSKVAARIAPSPTTTRIPNRFVHLPWMVRPLPLRPLCSVYAERTVLGRHELLELASPHHSCRSGSRTSRVQQCAALLQTHSGLQTHWLGLLCHVEG
jgi:hypothetical protein